MAWRISEESFLRDNAVLDNLKLRLGWGQIGNDKIDESSFSQVMDTNNPYNVGYVFGSSETPAIGATVLTYVNNGGKWEFTEQWNLGVDFGLWGNKLYGTADAYIRDTKDMLLSVTTPAHVGNRYYPKANVGTVRNQGIELMLGHANTVGEFSYDISGNVSFVKNRLTHLNGGSRYLDTYTNQLYDEVMHSSRSGATNTRAYTGATRRLRLTSGESSRRARHSPSTPAMHDMPTSTATVSSTTTTRPIWATRSRG